MFTKKQEDPGWSTGLLFGGITLVIVLFAFFALNYFNILSLSELYPKTLGWLPRQSVVVQTKAPTPQNQIPMPTQATNIQTSNGTFVPGLDAENSKGQLIKGVVVLYTLQGKITKVTPNNGKYNIEVNSYDGSQNYTLANVGGEGILKGTKGPNVSWSDLKPGNDVFVDLSVTRKDTKQEVVVNQIRITSE